MGTLYVRAPESIVSVMREVINRWHPDLKEADPSIGLILAYADVDDKGEVKGPAMEKKGFRILGKIKVNNLVNRVDGKPDATMTLDGDFWQAMEEGGRRDVQEALIDHELYHLVVQREKPFFGRPGDIKQDYLHRPVMTLRPHDWEITGFQAVAERNGLASVEVTEALQWRDSYGNVVFDQEAKL